MNAVLGPDRRTALEEERDFLLRSLRDLEAERAAGDVDEADYLALKDGYVARAADVLRELEPSGPEPMGAVPAASTSAPTGAGRVRRWAAAAGVAVFAVAAGLALARAVGDRTEGDVATGDVRESLRTRLFECRQLLGPERLLDAIKCYDAVLAEQPGNPEALTYRGWLLVLTGLPELASRGEQSIDQAIAADASYPDARAFKAIVLSRSGRLDAARAELAALDALRPPQEILDVVEQMGLRQRLSEARPYARASASEPGVDGVWGRSLQNMRG
ncbi:MAG: tetratricopeptide repeat protein [Acidimicrobiales bacterium]